MKKLLIAVLCLSSLAQARVFNMKENGFGGYFHATSGSSSMKKDFFQGESSATSYSKGFKTHTGGEFGFIYHTSVLSWIFGLEVVKPEKIKGAASTGATANYSYTSEVSVYAPKVGAEIVLHESPGFRFFVNGTVGTASLTSKTQYSDLTIAPNTDFTVEGKGSANIISSSIGGEWHWSDNTTFVLAYGYRDLKFNKIKYLEDVTSFSGAHTKGEQILKADGSALKYNFTNTYIVLGLRFWIH